MPSPPPPPPPLPVYYPQNAPSQSSSNANHIEEGRDAADKPPMRSTTEILCLSVIHNLTQLCIGGVVISAFFIPNIIDFGVLKQHIVLCTVGYFIIMVQAILSFSPVGWASSLKYENKRIIHSTMQILGSILAISGSAVQIANTELNLESNHGICGLVAMIFTVINLVWGVFNCFYSKKRKNNLLKILHVCLGTATISMAFIALIFAFHLYYRSLAENANANLAIGLAVFALFGILLMTLIQNARHLQQS